MLSSLYLKSFVTTLLAGSIISASTVEFQTSLGIIQGLNISMERQFVTQFRKIPYAEPPVGKYRFKKPRPVRPWQGKLNATQFGPVCPQNLSSVYEKLLQNTNISEDCLHLYIYIPNTVDKLNLKAVMVYIHGGGYNTKAGTLYDGSDLALHGDVIVVLLNYRLGMFGFLSTEDEAAKGNYGLWDQIQALKWIQDHISKFGGDPSKVTLVGHSAGGFSVGLLSLSPLTQNLFQRAICMSGFGTSERAITHHAKNTTVNLAKKVLCLNENVELQYVNSKNVVECLQNKSMIDILKATMDIRTEASASLSFIMIPAPVVDNEILLGVPKSLLSNVSSDPFKRFMSVDYMVGTNDADGGLLRDRISNYNQLSNYTRNGITTEAFCGIVIPRLVADYFDDDRNISIAICHKYFDNSSYIKQGIKSVEMYGDMMYTGEAERTIRAHSNDSFRRSYQFIFTHRPTFTDPNTIPTWIKGAYHGDEVPFIFRMPVYRYNHDEIELNKLMMTYLSNFARFGNVNGDDKNSTLKQPIWPEFEQTDGNYFNFNVNDSVGKHLYRDRMQFWLEVLPNIMRSRKRSDRIDISAGKMSSSTITACVIVTPTCYFFIYLMSGVKYF